MEALEAGEAPPNTWEQYEERIGRKRRWIDGIGILAATEVLERRMSIIQWSWRTEEWLCPATFEPRKTSDRKKAN
eukprot:3800943-Alexandrium_andersonii.AAC.1